jgi:hypothetical protein
VAPHNVAILHHIAVHSVCSTAEKSQNEPPDNTIVGGSVAIHAMMICQTTRFCTPAPDPAIVPAIPEEMISVVLTGKPEDPAVPISRAPTNSADAPRAGDRWRLPIRSPMVVAMLFRPSFEPCAKLTPEQVRITRSHRKFTLSCCVGPCRVRACPVGRCPVGPRRVAPATLRFVPTVKLTERS